MGCLKVNNFIDMHDKPQTFLTVVDKMSVHNLVVYGVSIYMYALLSLLGVMIISIETGSPTLYSVPNTIM